MWIVLTRSHAVARVFHGSPRHGRPAPKPPPSSSPPLSLVVALVVPLRARSFQLRDEGLHLSLLCAALVPDAADRAVRTSRPHGSGRLLQQLWIFFCRTLNLRKGNLRSSRFVESRPFHTLSLCCRQWRCVCLGEVVCWSFCVCVCSCVCCVCCVCACVRVWCVSLLLFKSFVFTLTHSEEAPFEVSVTPQSMTTRLHHSSCHALVVALCTLAVRESAHVDLCTHSISVQLLDVSKKSPACLWVPTIPEKPHSTLVLFGAPTHAFFRGFARLLLRTISTTQEFP